MIIEATIGILTFICGCSASLYNYFQRKHVCIFSEIFSLDEDSPHVIKLPKDNIYSGIVLVKVSYDESEFHFAMDMIKTNCFKETINNNLVIKGNNDEFVITCDEFTVVKIELFTINKPT